MRNTVSRHSFRLFALVIFLGLGSVTFAQPREQIGIVLVTKGAVQARSATGEIRTLARPDPIYQNDTILVGADGMAQLRMSDDARFSFKADTEFTFSEYRFDGDATSADSAVMSMIRGGFRTISGSIGDADEDTYRIDTPMASIGIRGTTHEAAIIDNTLFTGVSVGGTTISNNAGSIDTGIGGNFDFSATPVGGAPAGLLIEPEVLNNFDFAALQANTVNAEIAGDDSTGTTDDFPAPPNTVAANSVAATNALAATAADDASPPVNNPDSNINPLINSRAASELVTDSGGVLVPPPPGNGNQGNNGNGNNPGNGNNGNDNPGNGNPGNNGDGPGNGNNPGNNGNGNGPGNGNDGNGDGPGNGNNPGNNGNGPGNGNNSGNNGNGNNQGGNGNAGNDGDDEDPGNNGNGNNQGGNGNAGNDGDDEDPGNNGSGNNGNGNGNNNGNNNGNGNGGSTPIPGTAGSVGGSTPPRVSASVTASPLAEITTADASARIDALAMAWDNWNSAALPQVPNGEGAVIDLLGSVFQPANIAGMTGTASFAGSTFHGTDETGRVLQDVRFGFTVDFAGGADAITGGRLQIIDSDSAQWNVTFDGALQGSNVLMHNISGTFDSRPGPVTGDIGGFFTTAEGVRSFAGGFAVEAGNDFAQGVLIVDEVNNP